MGRQKWVMIDGRAINAEDVFAVTIEDVNYNNYYIRVQSVLGATQDFYLDKYNYSTHSHYSDEEYRNIVVAKQREIMEKLGIQIEGV